MTEKLIGFDEFKAECIRKGVKPTPTGFFYWKKQKERRKNWERLTKQELLQFATML